MTTPNNASGEASPPARYTITMSGFPPAYPGQTMVINDGTNPPEYLRVEGVAPSGEVRAVSIPVPAPVPWHRRLARWLAGVPFRVRRRYHLAWWKTRDVLRRAWGRLTYRVYRWTHPHVTDQDIATRFVERVREVFGPRNDERQGE